jgi:hypothetical protein
VQAAEWADSVAAVRDQLGEQAFDSEWAAGARMSLEEAITAALKYP